MVVPGTVTSSSKGESQSIATGAGPVAGVVVLVVVVGVVVTGIVVGVVVTGIVVALLALQQSAPAAQLLPADEKSLRQLSDPHTKSP